MLAETIEIPECLRAAVCPNCGYALEGLPRAGTCPECGRPYGNSQVVLHGFARGKHESPQNAKRSRLVWVILCSTGWFLIQFPQVFMSGLRSNVVVLAIAPLALAPLILMLLRRGATQHPGPAQLRLSEQGCLQIDDLVGPSELQKKVDANRWMALPLVSLVIAIMYAEHKVDRMAFWFWFSIPLIAAAFQWLYARELRGGAQPIPDGAIADAAAIHLAPTPWSHVTGFTVVPVSGGAHRVTVYASRPQVARSHSTPIDAEISCSPEVANELRGVLGQWVRRARQN